MEKSSKRWRFVILLVVLGICLAFLRPTINWYFRTAEADQKLALLSLEKIKEYSVQQAAKDVKALEADVAANPGSELGEKYAWLLKPAKKNFKEYKKSVPEPLTLGAAMASFSLGRVAKTDDEKKDVASSIHQKLLEVRQEYYREKVLADKKNYTNSVKLGLDLSGGMNIIVRADLDAAVKNNAQSVAASGGETMFKERAMEQAIETLKSRIDRFGLTEPVIRQQGEDRVYIEIPGAEQSDAINTIIMGKGILNFRLVDEEATKNFQQYYFSNPEAKSVYHDWSTINRVWAPQIVWDEDYVWPNGKKGGYMVYYSMWNRNEEKYDRMYYSYADESFTTLTQPQLLFDWGYATIDADINWVEADQKWHMMIKKEGGKPGLFTATAPALTGPWGEPVEDDYVNFEGNKKCEGVSAFQLAGEKTWVIGYIEYSSNPKNYRLCLADENMRNFHSPRNIQGVARPQHGSFLRLTKKEYKRLEKWSRAQKH